MRVAVDMRFLLVASLSSVFSAGALKLTGFTDAACNTALTAEFAAVDLADAVCGTGAWSTCSTEAQTDAKLDTVKSSKFMYTKGKFTWRGFTDDKCATPASKELIWDDLAGFNKLGTAGQCTKVGSNYFKSDKDCASIKDVKAPFQVAYYKEAACTTYSDTAELTLADSICSGTWNACTAHEDGATKSFKFVFDWSDDSFKLHRYTDDKCQTVSTPAGPIFQKVANFNKLGKGECATTKDTTKFAKLTQKCSKIETATAPLYEVTFYTDNTCKTAATAKAIPLSESICATGKWNECTKQTDAAEADLKSFQFSFSKDKFRLKRFTDDACKTEKSDKGEVFEDLANFQSLGGGKCAKTDDAAVFAKLPKECASVKALTAQKSTDLLMTFYKDATCATAVTTGTKQMWLSTTSCASGKWKECAKQDDGSTKSYKFVVVNNSFTLTRYTDDKCATSKETVVLKDEANFNKLGKKECAATSKADVFAKLKAECASIKAAKLPTTTTKKGTTTTKKGATTTKKGATTKAGATKKTATTKGGTTKKNGTNTTEASAAAATRVLTAIATVFTALLLSAS